jgi:peptidoglycan hydrolase-like protein with peptidoglycan-binding domain
MVLQSQLFPGDTKLEAAAVSDPAHILQGAKGPHVGKIQFALIELDDADITQDSIYGPETAAAVLTYKQKRNIVNRSIQTKADNIVGKMTVASLDREMFAFENLPSEPTKIRALNPGPSSAAPGSLVRRSNLLFAVKLDLDLPNFPSSGPLQKIRLEPRATGTLEIVNGKNGLVRCDNAKQQAGAFASQVALGARVSQIFNPADQRDSNASQRLVPEPKDATVETTFGGRLQLTKDPQSVSIDAFRPRGRLHRCFEWHFL